MAKPNTKVIVAECPECDTPIRFATQLKRGQLVTCPECSEQLEVRQLSPLELDWAYNDYDDDDDWD